MLPVEKFVQAADGYRCMDTAMPRSQSHLWRILGRLDNRESEGEHMHLVFPDGNKDTLFPPNAALAGNASTT